MMCQIVITLIMFKLAFDRLFLMSENGRGCTGRSYPILTGANSCPNICKSRLTISRFKFVLPCSIFLMTVNVKPVFSANSSWIRFTAFLRYFTKSAKVFPYLQINIKYSKYTISYVYAYNLVTNYVIIFKCIQDF